MMAFVHINLPAMRLLFQLVLAVYVDYFSCFSSKNHNKGRSCFTYLFKRHGYNHKQGEHL